MGFVLGQIRPELVGTHEFNMAMETLKDANYLAVHTSEDLLDLLG